jgi:Tol biopolymer transport system component
MNLPRGFNSHAAVAMALAVLVAGTLAFTACSRTSTTATSSPDLSPSPSVSVPDFSAPSPGPVPTTTVAGTIAFVKRGPDGNADIYSIRTDGTGLRRLTFGAGDEIWPAWSPDGRRIAYSVTKDYAYNGSYRMWSMDARGLDQRPLLRRALAGQLPGWSPDGKHIVFIWATPARNAFDLAVANADGGGARRLTIGRDQLYQYPNWAPDGRIYFVRFLDRSTDVWSVRPDGRGLRRVTRLIDAFRMTLSPDGKWLALNRRGHDMLVVVPASGRGRPVVLLDHASLYRPVPVGLYDFSWSRDGKMIAFAASEFKGETGSPLYIINADGSGLSVVPNTGPVFSPAWRPE